tara:strand:- start:763 stop:1113 length:351 start_codon:yes stop_codon:yes gene_type:complete
MRKGERERESARTTSETTRATTETQLLRCCCCCCCFLLPRGGGGALSSEEQRKREANIMQESPSHQNIHPENNRRGTETLSLITVGYEKLCAYLWRGSLCFIAAVFCIALDQMLIV